MYVDPEIIRLLAFLIGVIAFAALNAAYLVWLERKEAAHIQRRIGPKEVGPFGLLQPLVDGINLMTKQLIVPAGVDPVLFKIAPILVMVPAIMSFVTIPFSDTDPISQSGQIFYDLNAKKMRIDHNWMGNRRSFIVDLEKKRGFLVTNANCVTSKISGDLLPMGVPHLEIFRSEEHTS